MARPRLAVHFCTAVRAMKTCSAYQELDYSHRCDMLYAVGTTLVALQAGHPYTHLCVH